MSYYTRKSSGLCPRCGGCRQDRSKIMCEACREEELMRYYRNQEAQRRVSAAIRDNGAFMGLHVWLCRNGKLEANQPEYSI